MQTNESSSVHHSVRKRWTLNLLGAVVVALIAFGVYGPTLHYDLIFDDYASITKNDSIKQLFPLFGTKDEYGPLRPAPHTPLQVRPLVNLTLALNYRFGREDPWGYRLVNVVEHIAVTLVLWSVISLTLRQPLFHGRFHGRSKVLGFWAALAWMVHPVHQDAVVYVTQRTDLQMGFFYVLAILLSICFWTSSRLGSKLLLCVAAMGASACGMLCKEMGASAPAMIALYEWTFIGGSLRARWRRSSVLYVGLVLSWIPIVAMYAGGLGTPMAGFNNVIPAYDYWLTQSNSFFHYWRLVFCPWPLILHYHVPTLHSLAEAWPGVLGLSIYAIATAILVWKRTVLGFVLLWFFAILSPTLIVPLPHEEIAERRMYVTLFAVLPVVTIFLMLKVPKILGATKQRDARRGRSIQGIQYEVLACFPACAILIASIVVTASTVPRLEKDSEIWTYVLRRQPDDNYAIASQGMHELKRGEMEAGFEKLERAYRAEPNYEFLSRSLIKALDHFQRYSRMLEVCRERYEKLPPDAEITLDFATALEKNGQSAEAMEKYREVIELQPATWIAHSSLATLLAENGQVDEAIRHFETASELQPDYMNCVNLLTLYLHANQHEKAARVIPLILKASLKEHSPEEHQRVEREIRQIESQLRSPTTQADPGRRPWLAATRRGLDLG